MSYAQLAVVSFLEKFPQVRSLLQLLTEFALGRIHSLAAVLYNLASKLWQCSMISSLISLPQFQNLINHPSLQILIEHPLLKDCFPSYPTVSYQTATVMKNFMEDFDVLSEVDNVDTSKMTLTFQSTPVKFTHLLNKIQAIENDSMNAENFVWICTCVSVIFVVTSACWFAIFLASYGSKYRKSINGIAYFVAAILILFFYLFSMKLHTLGAEADALTSFLLACSYVPFTFLLTSVCCVSLYIMLFGTRRKKNLADDDVDENTVSNLRRQLSEQESAYKRSLSVSNSSNNELKSSEKSLMMEATAQENRLLSLKEDISKSEIATVDALRKWTDMTQKYDDLKLSDANTLKLLQCTLDGSNNELVANRQDTSALKKNLNDVTLKLKKLEIENSCITDLLSKTEYTHTSTGAKISQNVEKLKIVLKSELEFRELTKTLQAAKAQLTVEKKKLQSDLATAIKRDAVPSLIDEVNPICNSPSQSAAKNVNKKSTPNSKSKLSQNGVGITNSKTGTVQIGNIFEETREENANPKTLRKEESQQQQQQQVQANRISDVSAIAGKSTSGSGSGSMVLYDELKEIQKLELEREMKALETSNKNIQVYYDDLKMQLDAFIESNSVKIIEFNEKESSLLLAEKKILEMKSEESTIKTKLISF